MFLLRSFLIKKFYGPIEAVGMGEECRCSRRNASCFFIIYTNFNEKYNKSGKKNLITLKIFGYLNAQNIIEIV